MYIDNVFKAKMPVTATHDSHYCTCLGHLWWRKENRNNPISVAPPKGAKASTIVTVASHCHQHFCLKNIANVHGALDYKQDGKKDAGKLEVDCALTIVLLCNRSIHHNL
jgi:hypothetical protein